MIETTLHVRFPIHLKPYGIHAVYPDVCETERFRTANMTFKVTKGHRLCCRSIGHIRFPTSLTLSLQLCVWLRPIRFPVSLPLQLCLYLACTVSEILSLYFPKAKVTWPWIHPFSGVLHLAYCSTPLCQSADDIEVPKFNDSRWNEPYALPISPPKGGSKQEFWHLCIAVHNFVAGYRRYLKFGT